MKEKELIYYTTTRLGWEKIWRPVSDFAGNRVYDLQAAIKIVRSYNFENVGLARESQKLLNNAEWDNL